MFRLLTLSLLTLTVLGGFSLVHASRPAPERPQYGKDPKPNPRPPGPRDGNEE